MTAKLSEDLILELARNGNQPLSVEDPRTKKLYLLVAADEYVVSPQTHPVAPLANGEEWNETKNARRCALIDKEIAGTLSADEAVELARLQEQMLRYRRRVAPLPLEEMRELHVELMRRAEGS